MARDRICFVIERTKEEMNEIDSTENNNLIKMKVL